MAKWYPIIENDSFIVEYNKETNTYRVSYFEDNHFKDEICFRGYKELEWKEKAPEKVETITVDQWGDLKDNIFAPPYVHKDTEPPTYISPYCVNCPNHPNNGGNGICNCTLGSQPITYDTPYTTHTTMITDGCAAKGLRKEGVKINETLDR